MRSDYTKGILSLEDLNPDPLRQLDAWVNEAAQAGTTEPTGMCISTVNEDNKPSSRMVLLRKIDHGLVFFTNYESQKGQDILAHQNGCVNIWWADMERQIRVEGVCEKTSEVESDEYFYSRPYESQLASAASPQSSVITSREELELLMEDLRAQYPIHIPRPNNWGGIRLVPKRFEFWQGRSARLHDRFVYSKSESFWTINRLAP
jgi:pyridoxamine 5'-phosphate oxidase